MLLGQESNLCDQVNSDAEILEADYCPPLDPALFYAVLSDLDPKDKSNVVVIRGILDSLKVSADQEQKESETAFDPSGTSGTNKYNDSVASLPLDTLSVTDDSNLTTVTSSSNHLSGDTPVSYDEGIEELSYEEKTSLILELCPEATLFDVKFTLRKYGGSFRKALDETLSLEWIKNNHPPAKGVDAFFQDSTRPRRHKGKRKAKVNTVPDLSTSADEDELIPNAWQIKDKQIKFIASRVQLSESLIRSEYHKAGGSLRTTILNLCKVDVGGISGVSINDTTVQVNAAELGQDFPGLSSAECLALIILTNPFTARAHELAKAVFASNPSTRSATAESLLFVPQYARPTIIADDNEGIVGSLQNKIPLIADLDTRTLNQAASNQARIREEMFSKANAAWRKSRSNRMMGGAAAYYGEESRKANAASRAYSSAAADAQVLGTHTGKSIDLHGVNVQDAVRIAQVSVEKWWWDEGQAEWAREGKAANGGFAIITGAGTHSQGGRAKIRPAVIKMLRAEGWRVDENSDRAQLIVLGRNRVR